MSFRRPASRTQAFFALGVAVLTTLGSATATRGQAIGADSTIPAPAAAPPPVVESPFDRADATAFGAGEGADYVERAALLLRVIPHLQASIRCKTDMGGLSAIGTGAYAQSTAGDRRRVRLDLDLSVGENLRAQFLQVSDGDVVWIQKRMPQKETLERLRLQKLRKELASPGSFDPRMQLAEGGLSKLLFSMNESFAFGPPRRDELEGEAVWVVEGLWKPERLEPRFPALAESLRLKKVVDLSHLPVRTPTGARLHLRRSERLTYFPHRVEFTRQATSHPQSPRTVLLQYDLFEVREPSSVDDALFHFDPQGQAYEDATEAYREKHFPAAPPIEPEPGDVEVSPDDLTAGARTPSVR